MMSTIRVWIDQDLCTGDGLCAEIAPEIFGMYSDGLAYVKEATWKDIGDPPILQMSEGTASVPERLKDDVVESAEECPGECIFIEST